MSAPQENTEKSSHIKFLIWGIVVAAIVAVFLPAPLFASNLSFLFYMMLWITMATSFNFVAGLAGYMPFGYVAFYGIGAYATGVLYKTFGLPIPVALAGAALAGVTIGLLVAPTLRLKGVYFGIVSLALAMAMKLVISLMPSDITGGSLGLILSAANDPVAAYYAMFVVLMGALAAGTWLTMSRLGTALRAIRDDSEAAEVVGVNVVATRLKAWIMATMFLPRGRRRGLVHECYRPRFLLQPAGDGKEHRLRHGRRPRLPGWPDHRRVHALRHRPADLAAFPDPQPAHSRRGHHRTDAAPAAWHRRGLRPALLAPPALHSVRRTGLKQR
ncbi:branched-chain amino acid ABC transporter permease [Nitratireductor aquibiodomus]|uniref:branched-chain amino acid ABC transporter permease n=1 Tax=Nitratireductor aquibiodomus TaxID=204799 RepID=UPI001FCC4216|nr:branched-chain amino acid ABC transporter permease [Nitratireductor aquibiodomus]